MALFSFDLPAEWPVDSRPILERAWIAGYENVPVPVRRRFDDRTLALLREENESGSLSLPWPVRDETRIVSTSTLRVRPEPYLLAVELARGCVNRARNLLFALQSAEIPLPPFLHADLKDMSWMELYLFSITGRRFTAAQLKVLNAIWTYTSFPEPRLWNNRVAALAGTARSTGALGVAAAVAVSEASIYGRRPDIRAIDFLLRAKKRLDAGETLIDVIEDELHRYRGISGYGRPITRTDERIPHMQTLLRRTGMDEGPYVRLCVDIEKTLLDRRLRLHMNIAALYSAVALELGFTPRQYYLFMIPCFVAGMLPCAIEASEKPEGTFFPLRCERLVYAGRPRRHWDERGDGRTHDSPL